MNEIEGPGPEDEVHPMRDGAQLELSFGSPAKPKTVMWMVGLGVLATVASCGFAFVMEGVGGLTVMAAVIAANIALSAAPELWNARKQGRRPAFKDVMIRGTVTATPSAVETTMTSDPYGQFRRLGSSTDAYPQFRRHIERSVIERITTARSAASTKWGRGHEVRVVGTDGTEYVVAINCTRAQAEQLAQEMRAHLELASDLPTDAAKTAAELRDAVSQPIKGPPILPEQDRTPYEQD